jgi:DNA-binding transcriptional MerR regulator
MLISELAGRSQTPLATVKFYLREGVLMPGRSTSATRAEYGDEHVRRVLIIRALIDRVGLSIHQCKEVFAAIDNPHPSLFETLGHAIAALPPKPAPLEDTPRARAVIEALGQIYEPRYPAVTQLELALRDAEDAGMPLDPERLAVYGQHMREIARYELSRAPSEQDDVIEYSVLGTALGEPILAALRRLAHQDLAARAYGSPPSALPGER